MDVRGSLAKEFEVEAAQQNAKSDEGREGMAQL
jgi:hypothetical protein